MSTVMTTSPRAVVWIWTPSASTALRSLVMMARRESRHRVSRRSCRAEIELSCAQGAGGRRQAGWCRATVAAPQALGPELT